MTAPWPKLAEPFDPSEVKQRPGAATWDHKASCQGPKCRDTRLATHHMQFSYVDARAVMQRLDDVLSPSGWDFTSTVIPGTDIVRGELTIGGVVRVDYGYPNSDQDEEPVKAASSDALKRCAVMFGIGRHLYSDNTSSGGGRGPSSPARPPARPTVVPDDEEPPVERGNLHKSGYDVPEEPEGMFAPIGGHSAPASIPTDMCPIHNTRWSGDPGDLYHGPRGVVPGGYCRHPDNVKKARRA